METERLVIDRVRETDKEDYFNNISHDKKVLETFICNYAETLDDFDFSKYVGRDDLFAIRLRETGRLIGIILYFDDDGASCEIGYGLGSAHWGKGYATEAAERFIRFLFEEKGFRTVRASFFAGNDASRRVMEKCGMKFERFSPKELTYLGIERDLTYYSIVRGEVYRDERFTLGEDEGSVYLIADGRRYALTCHPFDPCLYVTDERGAAAAVRNSFDPFAALEVFKSGGTVTSITGREYCARDFCEMAAYAAGRGEIVIDDAEKVFAGRAKKKAESPKSGTSSDGEKNPRGGSGGGVLDNIAAVFPAVCEKYPDSAVDHVVVKDGEAYRGFESHRRALAAACRELFGDDEDSFGYDVSKARAKSIAADGLFAPDGADGALTYRRAFLEPPCGQIYTEADFEALAAALFPNGTEPLEVCEWTTDWSEYFDEGREWWGAICFTVYDKSLDRFVVIMASATD